jgi:hypothetical protein
MMQEPPCSALAAAAAAALCSAAETKAQAAFIPSQNALWPPLFQ